MRCDRLLGQEIFEFKLNTTTIDNRRVVRKSPWCERNGCNFAWTVPHIIIAHSCIYNNNQKAIYLFATTSSVITGCKLLYSVKVHAYELL